MTSTPLLARVFTRNWSNYVLFLTTTVPLLLGIVFVVSISWFTSAVCNGDRIDGLPVSAARERS